MKIPIYLSVIIPVHNEQDRLQNCIESLMPHARQYLCEVIIVDNGSTDRTREICDVARTIYPQVRSIHLARRGKGLAIKTGMLSATGRYLYMCDVDLSTPAKEIHRFLDHARRYDIVIGSREIKRSLVRTSLKRRVIGRIFHKFVRGLIPGVRDTQCGFKMFRDYAAKDIFYRSEISGMAIDVEALFLARALGYEVQEISVPWVNDPNSRVRLLDDGLEMLWDVLSLRSRNVVPGDGGSPIKEFKRVSREFHYIGKNRDHRKRQDERSDIHA